MSDDDGLTEIERLLLMAAVVHDLGPQASLKHANGGKVVGQALLWAGHLDCELREAWESCEYYREIETFYATLIRMTQQVLRDGTTRPPIRPGPVLFEGSGNLGTPEEPGAFPFFTAFHLTERGAQVGGLLLERHPQCVKGTSGVDFDERRFREAVISRLTAITSTSLKRTG